MFFVKLKYPIQWICIIMQNLHIPSSFISSEQYSSMVTPNAWAALSIVYPLPNRLSGFRLSLWNARRATGTAAGSGTARKALRGRGTPAGLFCIVCWQEILSPSYYPLEQPQASSLLLSAFPLTLKCVNFVNFVNFLWKSFLTNWVRYPHGLRTLYVMRAVGGVNLSDFCR